MLLQCKESRLEDHEPSQAPKSANLETVRRILFLAMLALAAACGGGSSPELAPLSSVSGRVNETIVVDLVVQNGSGDLSFDFMGPELPGLRATASGSAGGGTFRWTPLASHVGTHEFLIQLRRGGSTIDEEPLVITVSPSEDAAPVFVRPGAGGTFDLAREPCVRFDIEVRDDDSSNVTIAARGDLPDGAGLFQDGDKSGAFDWCPTDAQIADSERWTIPILADDGDHDPTELDYIAVLRTDAKPGCPGDPPVVNVIGPGTGERVTSNIGYEVRASVSDDMGLRDAPLLFYTTSMPDDPSMPDVTTFEQLIFSPDDGDWSARVPSLGLEDGQEQDVWILVSATDNDDATGASCDHRTDSALIQFTAVGGEGGGGALGDCDPCTESTQCGTGLCANAAGGARCVPSCSGDGSCSVGSCGATSTVEGGVLAGCGPVADICGGGGACTDDGREEDDEQAVATTYSGPISDGQICAEDDDWFRVSVPAGTRVTATLGGFTHASGDLDLRIHDEDGPVAVSASTTDGEMTDHCFPDAGTAFVRVNGYSGAQNAYTLTIDTEADPGMCCLDDFNEDNDDRESASSLSLPGGTGDLDGTICPRDDDWYEFNVPTPSRIEITLLIDDVSQDLDIELRGPSDEFIASSRSTESEENIDTTVSEPGMYALRVDGWLDAASDYIGSVTVTEDSSCSSSADCPLAEVCNSGSCESRVCSGPSCPSMHICPDAGEFAWPSECGEECTVNSDCRTGESCKRFWEGRYCGRKGEGLNGAACDNFWDCNGQRACIPWPNGACVRAGCTTSSDCETGSYCVDSGEGFNVCAISCVSSDDVCRLAEGYECSFENEIGRDPGSRFVCVPE